MRKDIYPVQLMRRKKTIAQAKGSIKDALGYLKTYFALPNGMEFSISKIIGIKETSGVNIGKISFEPVYTLTIFEDTMTDLMESDYDTGLERYESYLWDTAYEPGIDFNPEFSGMVDVYERNSDGISYYGYRDGNTFADYNLLKETYSSTARSNMTAIINYTREIVHNGISIPKILETAHVGYSTDDNELFYYDKGILTASEYLKSIYTSGDLTINYLWRDINI